MSRIYTTLKSYTKALVKENSEIGVPVQRPLFMHYEQDKRAYNIKYEYLYGRDILVAPVYEPGKSTWKVYLPEDEWIHIWTGNVYKGGDIEVDVPLGKPAIFYRKASEYVEIFKSLSEHV